MQHKTRGIILGISSYSDLYSIALIYTEQFGKVSYMIAGRKAKTTRVPRSLFYAMSALDLEVEHRNLREIQRIKEAKATFPQISLLTNPVKSTIAIFIAELTGKVVVETQENRLLFDYLLHSAEILELTEKPCSNFHLVFMVGLTRFLGIFPVGSAYQNGMYFNLRDGVFSEKRPAHPDFLGTEDSYALSKILRINYENMSAYRFSRDERKSLIENMIHYYRLHLSGFGEIRSLEVLHEVFE